MILDSITLLGLFAAIAVIYGIFRACRACGCSRGCR
jgi:hypothetical protein